MAAALALVACGEASGAGGGASEPLPVVSEPAHGDDPLAEPGGSAGPDTDPQGQEPPASGGEGDGASEVTPEPSPAGELPGAEGGAPPDEGGAQPNPAGPPGEPPSAPEPNPPDASPPASGGSAGVPDESGGGGAGGAGGTSSGEGEGQDEDQQPGGAGASGGGDTDGESEEEPPEEEPAEDQPAEDQPAEDDEPAENEDEESDEDEEADADEESDEDEESEGDLQPSFHLAVLGSSTAAGEGASAGRGWVSMLESSLARSASFTVSNFAVGGYTSEELLPRSGVRGNLADAIADSPDLIVVALAGSNDLSWGTSTELFFERLTTLRDGARAAGIPLFFVSTAPKDMSESQREQLQEWSLGMDDAFSSCWVPGGDGEHSPCFIDIFRVLASPSLGLAPQYGSGDGIHLNDAGHAAIHRAAEAAIRPYVCKVTRCR